MNSRISSHAKLLLFLSLSVLTYNEFLVYWFNYATWPKLHSPTPNENTTRLLLIADPQLIGENDEPWYQSWAAQWDSDRYLRNTFLLANAYVRPNSTIFLGDLFDEGLSSTDEQFDRYVKRFNNIYQCEKMYKTFGTQQIHISGDNDIGGEYFGDRTISLEKRFEMNFGSVVDLFQLNSFINLLKLDLDNTVSFYRDKKRSRIKRMYQDLKIKQTDKPKVPKFTVVLNHMSVFMKSHDEFEELVADTNACLIIKGDSHKFYLARYNFKRDKITEFHEDHSKHYQLDLQADQEGGVAKEVYELSIPTCSYRMGVPNMGFGVLTITSSGKGYLALLWLPSRFISIKYYVYYLIFVVIYIGAEFLFKKWVFRIFGFLYIKFNGFRKKK